MSTVFLFVFVFVLMLTVFAGFSGAPWVPVRKNDIEAILDELDVNKNKTILELGCGDGRFLKAAARRGAKSTGYEVNPILWLISFVVGAGDKNMKVFFGNMWKADVSSVDIVMAFLVPKTMHKLENKAAEMKPGSILISYIFKLPNKKPLKKFANWHIYKF